MTVICRANDLSARSLLNPALCVFQVRPSTALAPEPQLRHSYHTAILVTAFALCVVVVIGPFWIVLDSVTTRGEKARLMSQALVDLNKFARIW